MARCGQRLKREITQFFFLPVGESRGGKVARPDVGGDHRGTLDARQFCRAGDEVGMKVGLCRIGDRQTPLFRFASHLSQVPLRIHHQSTAVPQIKDVRGVAQSFVYNGDQIRCGHGRSFY